jgi:eukaryotic-like serine/threonine-protein kinase
MSGEAPSRIGKYEIRGKLGRGAMGEVFRGHDPVLGREVAIKVMSVGHADAELLQRFQREAQSAARLNHPNIITVYDFGDEDGKLYMAMELLEGHDVKDVMGKLSFEEKLGLMEQVAEALAFAHSKQVVHRDLKPANIHIQPNGQVKILDFGLAKLGSSSDMTRTGTVMGTPFYMSPEQVRGEKVDARSDIFSIGSVFYELLTDHKPFTAESMHAVLFQVLQNEPESVRRWAPDVPGIVAEVVEKCLAKEAAQRFADGGELRDALSAVHRAIDEGRGDSSSLAAEMPTEGQATIVERPKVARSGRGPGSSPRLAVAGATALRRAPEANVEEQATMVGTAGTVRGAVTRSGGSRTVRAGTPTPELASRAKLFAAVGVVVVLALGGAGYLFLKPGPAPPSPPPPSADGGLTKSLVDTQLALARRQLDDKDWKGAAHQAEQVLKLDASNAEAKQIQDTAQKTQEKIEKVAGEVRSAFEAGRVEDASAALRRLLALDPSHPAAAEFSEKLNSRFRGEAEAARQQMQTARGEAQRAGAGSGAAVADAVALARDGDAFFAKNSFADAARQFLASKIAFDRARREAARPTPLPTPIPTAVAVATPPPTPVPTPTAPPTAAPTPTAHPPTPVPTPPPPPDEEPAIRKLVADFGRAIESKNLALYKSLRPNLSPEDERKLRAAFEGTEAQQVSISIASLQVTGAEARARITRHDTFKGRSMDVRQTLVLAKGAGGWTIREITQ